MSQALLILGASARAAAFSARRAGYAPYCGDLFADVDLQERCPAMAVGDYPDGLIDVARTAPRGPWIYTGALENHPELVDSIAGERTLYGNSGRVLRAVRDPVRTAGALRQEGLACPAVTTSDAGVPPDGSWLRKPLRSAGGFHIAPWHGEPGEEHASGPEESRRWYFQELVEGESCAAVYVAARGDVTLIGVTRQLVGGLGGIDAGFRYAGSLGPLPLARRLRDQFERIGQVLSRRFELVGLFGVDAVVADETVWPVEVNPRYPASVEVLERGLGVEAMAWHVAACRQGRLLSTTPTSSESWCGKRIVYARRDIVVPPDIARMANAPTLDTHWPEAADVPAAGTRIAAGRPVITLLAAGPTRTKLEQRLNQQVRRLEELLYA